MRYSYLASPYQNPDNPADQCYMRIRFEEACLAAAQLMAQGRCVFSPIAHSHPIADFLDRETRTSHDFWLKQDFALLEHADKLLVLMLYQWNRSFGVAQEIVFAQDRGIPVEYLDPEKL